MAQSLGGIGSSECNIELTGLLSRRSCSSLAIELLKYILFQKGQLPEPYETILQYDLVDQKLTDHKLEQTAGQIIDFRPKRQKNENEHSPEDRQLRNLLDSKRLPADQKMKCGGRPRPTSSAQRKKQQSLGAIQEIFSQIELACEESEYPIQSMAFILGSSVITPKETYCLTFPNNHLEGKDISFETLKKTFFRQVVTSDFLSSFDGSQTLGLQKLTVLLLTNRRSNLRWFNPNPRFILPKRGKQFHLNVLNDPVCDTSISVGHVSTMNISGISPFDMTMESLSAHSPAQVQDQLDISFEQLCDEEDLIWYQAPQTFQGFK